MQRKPYSGCRENSSSELIYILGICPRSGTNYMRNILALHPDCDYYGPIGEDKLLFHASLLESYVNSTYKQWPPKWKVNELVGPPEVLCGCLGDGLIQFLKMQPKRSPDLADVASLEHGYGTLSDSSPKRLLTKTPNVQGLPYFFKFFPLSRLLIVIRDGRSVAESGVRTFNWSYENAIRKWARGARTILKFDQDRQNANRKYLIVRYEDVYLNTEQELRKVFQFLGLDAEKYDFGSALNLKVSGSSDLSAQREKKVHWRWVEKPVDFNPIDRWNSWGRKLHERFNWIAGNYLDQFGYRRQIYEGSWIYWRSWNLILDIKLKVRAVVRRVGRLFHTIL